MHLSHIVASLVEGLDKEVLYEHLAADYLLYGADCSVYRTVARSARLEFLTRDVEPDARHRTHAHSARHLQIVDLDSVAGRAVLACEHQYVLIRHLSLLIGKLQEVIIALVERILLHVDSEHLKTVFESRPSAPCGEHYSVLVDAYVFRIDDLVALAVFQHSVLMYARRVGECVAPYDRLVGLNGHVHHARHHAAYGCYLLGVDVGLEIEFGMRPAYHHYLLERSVAGTLADAVDRDFSLARSVHEAGERVGRSHTEIVVAVGGYRHVVDAVDMLHKILYLLAEFTRQTVAGSIGDIDYCGSGLDDGLHHSREVFVVGAPGVFRIELNVFYKRLGVFHAFDGPFKYFLRSGVELILYVIGRCAYARMYTRTLRESERLGGDLYVGFHRAGQSADGRPCDGLRYLLHGSEIAGARHRKSCLDDIHSEPFELLGHLDFLICVEPASRHLLAVAERRIENIDSVTHIPVRSKL